VDWWKTIVIYLAFIIVLYYILIWLPRRMQNSKHRRMINNLKIGTRVVTVGGLFGRVYKVNKDTVLLEVSVGTVLEVSQRAISHPVSDGDAK
jgi:preprotein translocase subunit YajC